MILIASNKLKVIKKLLFAALNSMFVFEVQSDVVHVSYHPISLYPNCQFNQLNPQENDDRTKYYGVFGSTPRLVIQEL